MTPNEEADYRRNVMGHNVIPADCANKRPLKGLLWSEYQDKPISQETHDQWKTLGLFDNGMAMIMGKKWFGERAGKYGAVLDFDNEDVVNKWFGNWAKVEERAETDRIEWHGNRGKLHYYVDTEEQLNNDNSRSISGLEIRAKDELVYSGQHKDGNYWTPIGTDKVRIRIKENIESNINGVATSGIKVDRSKLEKNISALERNSPNHFKHAGENRSLDLLQEMDSLILRNQGLLSTDEIKELAIKYHKKHHEPYPEEKVNALWYQALEYTSLINQGRKDEAELNRRKFKNQENSDSWSSEELFERYEHLKKVIEDNIPDLWPSMEFSLSVKLILNMEGCSLPFAGVILGPSGGLKTVNIELFRESANIFYTDKFSPRSLVSHNSAVKKEKLVELDMLPKIKNKFFLTPEMAPTFAADEKELLELLGILTRVLDGQGYASDTGSQGHREYKGKHMFTMLAASVEIPPRVWKCLSQLGPRLYFFRLDRSTHDSKYYQDHLGDDYSLQTNNIREALNDYLDYLEINPSVVVEDDSGEVPKIPFDHTNYDPKAKECIAECGMLLGPLRALVPTYETKDSGQGLDYGYRIAIVEEPRKAITLLRNLACGHALSQGRNHVTVDDMPLVIKVALSSASLERVKIFELLLKHEGTLSTSNITDELNVSRNTALRTMAEMKATGLVDLSEGGYTEATTITLKDDFSWFKSPEFKSLRGSVTKNRGDVETGSTSTQSYIKKNKLNIAKPVIDTCLRGGNFSLHSKAHFSGQWWYCKTCKYRDDGPGMEKHVCKNKESKP